jgi:hypothetical protein
LNIFLGDFSRWSHLHVGVFVFLVVLVDAVLRSQTRIVVMEKRRI